MEEKEQEKTNEEKVNTIFRIRLEKMLGRWESQLKNKIQIRAHCMRYLLEYYYTCGDARSISYSRFYSFVPLPLF